MASPPLSADKTLSSPPQAPKQDTHITPVKRRSSARLSQTPQLRTPSLTDSPIPVLTPPNRDPDRRETPRKTPRGRTSPLSGVTKQTNKPTKSKTIRKRASNALANAYVKDAKLKQTAASSSKRTQDVIPAKAEK